MGSFPQSRQDFEQQNRRLEACEENLRRHHQLALAGQLVGATLHEVNNGLEILTNLNYLAKTSSETDGDPLAFLKSTEKELRRLGDITSRRLTFIRADGDPKDFDLVELASAALELHKHKISGKSIDVRFKPKGSVVASVKRGEVLQVFVNLLMNAIDALPDSGKLHVRIAQRGGEAVITIADNGKGIPEAIRPTLFESFKSSKEHGNGMGLWIVKKIVDGHRGRIRYRTNTLAKRSGTIFRVSLPIRSGAEHNNGSGRKQTEVN
jgi:signal transduction histidine kinase